VTALTGELGAALELVPPDQGKRLSVFLSGGVPDGEVEQAAANRGVNVHSLSPLYRRAPARSSLFLGFAGYPANLIASAAEHLAFAIDQVTRDRKPLRKIIDWKRGY
jgi:GntR family transcriptional regulator/MocR family aminotransferase